jgi:glycosyltransferase involved in cell wall biosynthesis
MQIAPRWAYLSQSVGLPAFSMVVPSFCQQRFLRRAIDSVLTQEGVELTLDVRDGGSRDGSLEILRSYGAAITWKSAPDGGQVNAVNSGLGVAAGELMGFLNSDDLLFPGTLRKVAEFFSAHPGVDVVYGRAWWIDESDRPTHEYPTLPFDPAVLVEHCFVCQPAAFWRRSVHTKYGWFDPAFDNAFDYEFWLRLAVRGANFAYLPEFLAGSRRHEETKTTRNRAAIFREIRSLQMRHLGYCGRNWWEQQLRYWRDESGGWAGRLLPGRYGSRLYRLAWWPYAFYRRKLGGPLLYRPGHWRA